MWLQFLGEDDEVYLGQMLVRRGGKELDEELWRAASAGSLEVVKFLVGAGADVGAMDNLALRWASVEGRLEVVKFLVEAGADVGAMDNQALRWASMNGHSNVANYLKSVLDKKEQKT